MDLFPYPPRPFQAEAVARIRDVARQGGHLVLEAPTGMGKTVVLLSGALEAALATNRRVLYVTRTNSQQEQALRELRALADHRAAPIAVVALQGRQGLCLKLEDVTDPELIEADAEELGHFCSHAKRVAESEPANPQGCAYWRTLSELEDEKLHSLTGPAPLTAEAFKRLGRTHGFCSYEAAKRLLPRATVVIAPYIFAFHPALRRRLLQWWGVAPEELILVVDEAHNLPAYVRQLHSPRLTQNGVRLALAETETLPSSPIAPGGTAREFVEALREILDATVAEYAPEEDGIVPPFEVEAQLLSRFRTTTSGLLQVAAHLATLGEVIKDRRRLEGRVPRSALSRLSEFLEAWIRSDESAFVKLAVRQPHPSLEAFCVDASETGELLNEHHATLHASGTLTPLSEYRDALGLPSETQLDRFPSPFPPNRLEVLVTRGLTTRYEQLHNDPVLVDRLQDAVRRLVEAARVSAAVFFPSHQLAAEFREVGALESATHQLLVEQRALSQEGLMGLVSAHRLAPGRSLLVGVVGGRLSEGLDFPGRQLEAVVLVGVPFPKPTARQRSLFRYYEARHGRGWEYAVQAPAQRLLRQAIGRLIRTETDRGFAVILDERAAPLLREAGVPLVEAGLEEVLARFQAWQTAHPPVPPPAPAP